MHPVVAFHDENGVIQITQTDNGQHGLDGEVAENGLIIHRIYSTEEFDTVGEFISRYVWCNDLGWWKLVPERPNPFAYWDTTLDPHAWNWDVNIFLSEVRLLRDRKLSQTDWMVLPDSPLSETDKTAILSYRQELRDYPSTLTGEESSIEELLWPEQPVIG